MWFLPKQEREPQPGNPGEKRDLPPGVVEVHNAVLTDVGKQYIYDCGMKPCAKQYAAFSGLNDKAMLQGLDLGCYISACMYVYFRPFPA